VDKDNPITQSSFVMTTDCHEVGVTEWPWNTDNMQMMKL